MRKEGETIWQTGADMNQLGTERAEDRQGGRGFTVMGTRGDHDKQLFLILTLFIYSAKAAIRMFIWHSVPHMK